MTEFHFALALTHFFLTSNRVAKGWGWDFGQNLSNWPGWKFRKLSNWGSLFFSNKLQRLGRKIGSRYTQSCATVLSGKCQAETLSTLNITLSNILATLRLKSVFWHQQLWLNERCLHKKTCRPSTSLKLNSFASIFKGFSIVVSRYNLKSGCFKYS